MGEKLGVYPICDTDFWIKLFCLIKKVKVDLTRCKHECLYVPDAVRFELNKKKIEEHVLSSESLSFLRDKLKLNEVYIMNILDSGMFDDKERKYILRAFSSHQIAYSSKEKSFRRSHNLGEKVSLIYAAAKKLPVVLSDDGGAKSFRSIHFKNIEVYNVKEALCNMYGYSNIDAQKYIDLVRKHEDDCEKSNLKSQSVLGQYKKMLLEKEKNN